jgi:D-sedoheptulose 7-phosphate isomerase
MTTSIESHLRASIDLRERMVSDSALLGLIEGLGLMAAEVLRSHGTIFLAGNGGSFADAQHIAAEFVSKLKIDRRALPAIALGTNSSSMSAIGNDYGFEHVFSREIMACARSGDLFIPISTSGKSSNILLAINQALSLGINVVGLTGMSGGEMAKHCSCICVPSVDTALIQECHITIGHMICAIAEQEFIS